MIDRPALYTPADLEGWRVETRRWTERDIAMIALVCGAEWVEITPGEHPWSIGLRCRATLAVIEEIRVLVERERPQGWLVTVDTP